MPAAARAPASRSNNSALAAVPAIGSAEALAQYPFRPEIVPLSRMFVDHDYQRPLTSFVETIERDFKPQLVQCLSLSERSSGKLAVMDGQTRMVALERLGFEAWFALVYTGLSKAQEAEIFVLLQTQRRTATSWTRFRGQLQAKNPESLAIKQAVESLGLKIGDMKDAIKSVAALEYGYRIDPFLLERSLVVLTEAWPDRVPDGQFIRALVYFFKHLAGRVDIDDEKLVRRLKVVGPEELSIRASHLRASGSKVSGSGAKSYLAQAILNAYRS